MPNQSIFETILASSVHDMKNSLSLLMGQLDQIASKLESDDECKDAISSLRYESSRINLSMMQLLSLYKFDHDQLTIRRVEVEVQEFLEDCIAAHQQLANISNIHLIMDCDDELIAFFDPDLIGIVINNIIGNSIRYTDDKVLVKAKFINKALSISISDNGKGYPDEMLQQPEYYIKKISHSTGSTGLGLYFAAIISQKHEKNGEKGTINLENHSELGGGKFEIVIP